MNLFLVRHPKPDVMGLCYGRRDVPITAAALAESVASIRAHAEAGTLLNAEFFSSPAPRCAQLARALAAPREPLLVDDLMEMHFGAWEGLPWDDVPRAELTAWADDVWSYRTGGGESAALVAARWLRWCDWLAGSGIGTALAVTHAGVIRVARLCCGDLCRATFAQAAIEHGSVHRIDLAATRAPA